MTTRIEAKRLSGIDRGKTITALVPGYRHTGPWELAGTLDRIHHLTDGSVTLTVTTTAGEREYAEMHGDALIAITGIMP